MTDSQPAVRPSDIRTGKRQISEFCFRCLWNMAVRSFWLVDVWFQAWWQNPERPSLMWWRKHQNHDWSPPRIRRRRRWGGHCMMMRCWPLKLNRAAGLWGRSFMKHALITTETLVLVSAGDQHQCFCGHIKVTDQLHMLHTNSKQLIVNTYLLDFMCHVIQTHVTWWILRFF